MKNRIMGELKKVFRPEFLNRIDDVIVFHKLQQGRDQGDRRAAAAPHPRVDGRARAPARADRGGQGPAGREGLGPAMGARPLRRAIQRYIEDPLADFVLRAELHAAARRSSSSARPRARTPRSRLAVVDPKKVPAGVGGGATEAVGGRRRPSRPRRAAKKKTCAPSSCPAGRSSSTALRRARTPR